MADARGFVEPIGARTLPGEKVEVVLDTSEGVVRVVMDWNGWQKVGLMIAVVKAELLGINAHSMMSGEVAACEADWRPTLTVPEKRVK